MGHEERRGAGWAEQAQAKRKAAVGVMGPWRSKGWAMEVVAMNLGAMGPEMGGGHGERSGWKGRSSGQGWGAERAGRAEQAERAERVGMH